MAALTNVRHEQFAALVAGGMPVSRAYQQAGFSGRGAPQSACRLAKTPAVANRIAELKKDLSDSTLRESLVDRQWVMARLKYLAETAETASARIRALELCGKAIGMFKHEREDSFSWDGDLTTLTSEQLARLMASLEAMIAAEEAAIAEVQ
jgi:hypothetical protein